ncbi:Golgi resident protein GCP60-like [Lethenteron reissneri]|uniref:Golgi resident protein GCP60-like n=1 Tax=Lethenteron reissneri TaxID=7753 RepID=UPI002AB6C693|nr:Golgi resident protein GCP60-like [Lethenteron reissneri]
MATEGAMQMLEAATASLTVQSTDVQGPGHGNAAPDGLPTLAARSEGAALEERWGIPRRELFVLALRFYKDNVGEGFPASAQDRARLQAACERAEAEEEVPGSQVESSGSRPGDAGDSAPSDDARAHFTQLLIAHCPLFVSYMLAQRSEGRSLGELHGQVDGLGKSQSEVAKVLGPDGTLMPLKKEKPAMVPPVLWTSSELRQFKTRVAQEPHGVLRIGCGEVGTVRVPTRPGASHLCWEFATDSYDLAFGLYFEWNEEPGCDVTVSVSESSDEEDEDDDEGVQGSGEGGAGPSAATADGGVSDVERGSSRPSEPPLDEVEPLCRRNCHELVQCGTHCYPGVGLYHLKFDNSYSLWRSKTLYYRVYYN